MTLICPKCRGEMHQYERNGVVIEQCGDCRGLFLDRGELERLAAAESSWHEARRPDNRYPDDRYRESRSPSYGHGQHPRKKRRSFLEDLFD